MFYSMPKVFSPLNTFLLTSRHQIFKTENGRQSEKEMLLSNRSKSFLLLYITVSAINKSPYVYRLLSQIEYFTLKDVNEDMVKHTDFLASTGGI